MKAHGFKFLPDDLEPNCTICQESINGSNPINNIIVGCDCNSFLHETCNVENRKLRDHCPTCRTIDLTKMKKAKLPETLTEKHVADAECKRGMDHYFGSGGVAKDVTQAIEWIHKAAERNYAEAQFTLGNLYDPATDDVNKKGRGGIVPDLKQAVEWYYKAAMNEHNGAQYNLGIIYESGGEGVDQDPKQAAEWYYKAAMNGHPGAKTVVGQNFIEAPILLNEESKESKESKEEKSK